MNKPFWITTIGAAATLSLGALGILVTQPRSEPPVNPSPTPIVVASQTPSASPTPSPSATPTTPPVVKKPTWRYVREFKGRVARNTKPFDIKGKPQRVWVKVTGKPAWASVFALTFEPADPSTDDFTMLSANPGKKGRRYVTYLEPGRYYLRIMSANCVWRIVIREYR